MRIYYVPCDSTIKNEKDLWSEWSSWKARCTCCTFSLLHGLKEICCLELKSTRFFRKMDIILSPMYRLPWERQIPSDTMESRENPEHILSAWFKFVMWFSISQRISYSFFFCDTMSEGLPPHIRPYNPGLPTSPAKLQHSFLLPFRTSFNNSYCNCTHWLQWEREVKNPSCFKMSEWYVDRWLPTELHSKELTD